MNWFMFQEPPINPDDDTHPTQTVPLVDPDGRSQTPGWQRWVGLLSLLGALTFTLATIAILVLSPNETPQNGVSQSVTDAPTQDIATLDAPEIVSTEALPTSTPHTQLSTEQPSGSGVSGVNFDALPTLSNEDRANLLATPMTVLLANDLSQIERGAVNPFTIIPDRPRNTVIDYVVEKGDTINGIAQRFGLQQESIAWSNDRRLIWVLPIGAKLQIPPADGVMHQAIGGATIAEIASRYKVADPLSIVDSQYNPSLNGLGADYVPPSGMMIFIPGGEGEAIDWTPPSVQTSGGGGTSGGNGLISFEPGAGGSCLATEPGQGTSWGRPLSAGAYVITRTYASWHQGIDLASSPGTPVYAANGGKVIFAGGSNRGYGNAVVISHGPYLTLYGHLSTVNVSCHQIVGTGQVIGGVGSTGQSSGPHLHFEIMTSNGGRFDPASTIPF